MAEKFPKIILFTLRKFGFHPIYQFETSSREQPGMIISVTYQWKRNILWLNAH
ncbi:hypothetical protein [Tolypothrix sp. PCC 7712]|uniref:hypothetical protein n=1 Tax=Tolypothrix sp. PCC 7712 TaxID=2596898 RepID=UPI0021F6C26A|nr:hypothetical protein [Tolypothrix sp. PCC 7712]